MPFLSPLCEPPAVPAVFERKNSLNETLKRTSRWVGFHGLSLGTKYLPTRLVDLAGGFCPENVGGKNKDKANLSLVARDHTAKVMKGNGCNRDHPPVWGEER